MEDRKTVTATQAMAMLGVSRMTLSRMIRRGELEAYKLTLATNSPYQIYLDSLTALLARRQETKRPIV